MAKKMKLIPRCNLCGKGINDKRYMEVWLNAGENWPRFFAHRECIAEASARFRAKIVKAEAGANVILPKRVLEQLAEEAGYVAIIRNPKTVLLVKKEEADRLVKEALNPKEQL